MEYLEQLEQFLFNVETLEMLRSFNTPQSEILTEMSELGFTSGIIHMVDSPMYKSVLLRLRLCFQKGMGESEVRQSFERINNKNVNEFLDYMFSSQSSVVQQVVEPIKQEPVVEQVVAPVEQVVAPVKQESEDDEQSEDEEDYFDTFFTECVRQTDDAVDSVNSKDFYSAFTSWWGDNYDDDVPDKKELKSYLKEKLGKDKKGTWTNVALA